VDAAIAGLAGIVAGAVLTSLLQHRAWLRERRLTEYAGLLAAFRKASAESAKAVQGGMIFTDPHHDPEHRQAMHELVVSAWDTGDDFLAAHDQVKLVATADTMLKADALRSFILTLRTKKPLSDDDNAGEITREEFEQINRDAIHRAADFADAATADIVYLKLRVGR
jgi:hypothetical protein